jgi:hypothetical protein
MSCFFKSKEVSVSIQNNSSVRFDSAHAFINNHKIKFNDIQLKERVTAFTTTDSISAGHDVLYSFKLFIKDSIVGQATYYSNDMGYVENEFKVIINDSLQIKRDISQ